MMYRNSTLVLLAIFMATANAEIVVPAKVGDWPVASPEGTADDCSSTGRYTSCFYNNGATQCKCPGSGPWSCGVVTKDNDSADVEEMDVGVVDETAEDASGGVTVGVVSTLIASGALAAIVFGL